MKPQSMQDHVIRPTLMYLGNYSSAAAQLVLATMAQETHVLEGFGVQQEGGGPAMGASQIEPATEADVLNRISTGQRLLLKQLTLQETGELENLHGNLFYQAALTRLKYWLVPKALPDFGDIEGMWLYYKKYWNSMKGAATQNQFEANWAAYVRGVKFK